MSDTETSRVTTKRGPRFSLLTILTLMALLACGITIWRLWIEVDPLRAEVRTLRNETGRLSIDDPTKPHVVQVRGTGNHTWKWRLWIPEGSAYQLHMASERIPAEGYAQSNGMMTLDEPGEIWVEYRISRDAESNAWTDKLSTPNAWVGSSPQPWISWSRKISTSEGVGHDTKAFELGEKILITRYRVSQQNTSSKIEDPAAGFMIWLKPTK